MTRILVPPHDELYRVLQAMARQSRLVFFAGLPGTGKSLLIHQLVHVAAAEGRDVHLLQWDVARPVFEKHPDGRRYPQAAGVTHGVIRKAAGLWARPALVRWHRHYPAPDHLLIGETPLIGQRFIELARRYDDAAERLLADDTCVFGVPLPSSRLRQHIAAERQRRAVTPLHPKETEDASPEVMQALWEEVVRVAQLLGVRGAAPVPPETYDVAVYQRVYLALLKHRHVRVVPLDTLLPTGTVSVYDFTAEPRYVLPAAAEVRRCIRQAEQLHDSAEALQRDMEQWYRVEQGPDAGESWQHPPPEGCAPP